MSKSSTPSETSSEKKEWEKSRDHANGKPIETASSALQTDALTETTDPKINELSELQKSRK